MKENRRKQGNVFDAESLGGIYRSARASGRQGWICFYKYILCILIHWDYRRADLCVWMKLGKECLRDQPDPAQSHAHLGKGTARAQFSFDQYLPAGAAHPADFLGWALCVGMCLFL